MTFLLRSWARPCDGAAWRRTVLEAGWGLPLPSSAALPRDAAAAAARGRMHVRTFSAGSGTKSKQVYVCKECGAQHIQWHGSCPSCKLWGKLELSSAEPLDDVAAPKGGIGALARAISASQQQQQQQRHAPAQQHAQPVAAATAAAERNGSAAALVAGEDAGKAEARLPPRGTWVHSNTGPQRLSDVRRQREGKAERIQLPGQTGLEVSRVLGGGIMPGSLVLVGGDPGVGKSTLMLQVAMMLAEAADAPAQAGQPVLYVSGEESVHQIASRAERMSLGSPSGLLLYSETSMDTILRTSVEVAPSAIIVDSVQTVYLRDVNGSAGSVSQVRECCNALLQVAKRQGCPVFLVGHVTKSGDIAGPKVLEHAVDVVLYLEGERRSAYRLLRGIKNRFGATDEVGVFEMKQGGLEAVPDPSALFLGERQQQQEQQAGASSAVTVLMEGSRPMCMEVQALCSPTAGQSPHGPRRVPSGIRPDRLGLLLAVLQKHGRMALHTRDVFVNVVGGMLLTERSSDLAVAVAIASSFYDRPVAHDAVVMGEVGLGGELRAVSNVEKRLMECSKLGFRRAVVPRANKFDMGPGARWQGLEVVRCGTVAEALHAVLQGGAGGGSGRRGGALGDD